ncbi:MAG: hypothetical protein ACK40K_01830 [Raineya sp.]
MLFFSKIIFFLYLVSGRRAEPKRIHLSTRFISAPLNEPCNLERKYL